MDQLASAVAALPAAWRGRYAAVVVSTQDEARLAALAGAPGRSLFVADYQRAGRGRQGRTWEAEPGTSLLLSMLFREVSATATPLRWTSLTSLSLVEAIECVAPGVNPAIKWPNDVMLDDRKVAGVLAETIWNGRELQVIVGMGVNVNARAEDLESVPRATSLSIASGRSVDRGLLLSALVERVDHWADRPPAEVHAAWRARLWGRGQSLRLVDMGHEERAVVLGVDADGALLVRLADGSQRRSTTGELLF
ncbi:MAG TPA: biotin--[acetyl-CoA-carboxylase] ligase [Chloroflexota bacterium]